MLKIGLLCCFTCMNGGLRLAISRVRACDLQSPPRTAHNRMVHTYQSLSWIDLRAPWLVYGQVLWWWRAGMRSGC